MLVTLSGMVTLVKPLQSSKRILPNARNAVGDGHAGQTAATSKRPVANARNAVGDGHAGQGAKGNAQLPMLVTLLPRVTLFNAKQL